MKLRLTTAEIHEYWIVNPETGLFINRHTGKLVETLHHTGYILIGKRIDSKQYRWVAHQLMWVAMGNQWPNNQQHIHHLNGNRADNRYSNLELLSVRDHINHHNDNRDMKNLQLFSNGTYQIKIKIHGKYTGFGSYKSLEEAQKVRDEVLEELREKGMY